MPKRSCEVIPLSESAQLNKKNKKSHAEFAENKCAICKIEKEKEIRASFAVTTQTEKIMATTCDKCLVSMEKDKICGWKT